MPVLAESDIPEELWAQEMLFMPACLSTLYVKLLQDYGIMNLALSSKFVSGPIGGKNRKETLQHFSLRYGVSVCRVESLLLDPHIAFRSVSKDLVTSLSSGRISILDTPCGTGAVGASLLSTIAVLRKNGVLPKLPLDIHITGGDFSDLGREIYEKIITKLEPSLNSVGVSINFKTVPWDGTNPDTTALLVDTWFDNSTEAAEYLAIVANFSGEAGKRFIEFQRSFQHIHERLYNKKCTMIWVEPEMRGAKTFFEKIKLLFALRKRFQENPLAHTYYWHHPLQKCRFPCTVLVYQYERS